MRLLPLMGPVEGLLLGDPNCTNIPVDFIGEHLRRLGAGDAVGAVEEEEGDAVDAGPPLPERWWG